MNQKSNLVVFLLLSMAMLFLYSWMTQKNAKQPVPLPSAAQTAAAAADAAEVLSVGPSLDAAAPAAPGPEEASDKSARFVAGNELLELTWRQYDGTLVQAVWKQDGTRFFPAREQDALGRLTSAEFLGLGGGASAAFSDEPQVLEEDGAKTIVFTGQAGDRLTYRLPNDGFILDVEWLSPQGRPLWLIRSLTDIPQALDPFTGKIYPANPLQGLENGRVFTLEEKNINAVAWGKMLEDPWFMFLGRERATLPPVAARLGMDAGFEASKKQMVHYFAAIWDSAAMPRIVQNPQPGYVAPVGTDGRAAARLYLGPKQAEHLAAFHPKGEPNAGKVFLQVMDFGFFGLIAKLLFMLLKLIQGFIPNWGWALVTFGFLLRLVLWPLNTKTTLNMLRQKDLEPREKEIKAKYAKYAGDKMKQMEMQREVMAFHKKNGHNMMGGCLPMLLQMPIFMALWSMLQNVFELRHAPWILWIKDLSASDPFFVLPLLMVGSMVAQQAMTPPMGDPAQRKMMMVVMPIMMGFFFAYTPAGLTVYYLLYNVVGMGQMWWQKRNYKPQPVVI